MGPQFAHLQTFCRKMNPAGQCVDQVIAELIRIAEFSLHVRNPAPPKVVDGLSPEDLRVEHDAMIEAAFTPVMVRGEMRRRAIRKDRHTLMTAVVSYPLTHEEVAQDPGGLAALREWEARNVAFF